MEQKHTLGKSCEGTHESDEESSRADQSQS